MIKKSLMMKRLPLSLVIAAAGVSELCAAVEDTETLALEEIVITAQRRSQSAQEVPIALTTFSEDILRQTGVEDIGDLTDLTPGFSIGGAGDALPSAYIRGVGSNSNGPSSDPSVGVYIDGVYASRKGGALVDLMDIERVEILKGPQGTLFGRNSIGGAISLTTPKPKQEFGGILEAEIGNYNSRVLKGLINLPLIDDKMAMRASVVSRERDGWQKNTIDGERGHEQDKLSGRVRLLWEPVAEVEVDLTGYWDSWDGTSFYTENLVSPPGAVSDLSTVLNDNNAVNGNINLHGLSSDNRNSVVPVLKRSLASYSAVVNWDITDELTFTSQTSFRKFETETAGEYDGSEFLVGNYKDTIEESETVSQEFRLSGVSESLDWFVGVVASKEENSLGFVATYADLPAPFSFNGLQAFSETAYSEVDVDSYAVFGDAIWNVTDRLSLTFGARYSYDKKNSSILNPVQVDGVAAFSGLGAVNPISAQFFDANGNPDPSLGNVEADWDAFTPRFVANYKLSEDVMVYGSVSAGYKSGSLNTLVSPDLNPFSPNFLRVLSDAFEPVKPETVVNYELGVKSSLLENRLTLNGSLFHYEYDDLQVSVLSNNVTQLANAGKATGQGMELEFVYLISQDWSVMGNGLWLDAQFDDFINAGQDLAGKEILFSPDYSGSISLDYHTELGDLGTFRAFATYSYVGDHTVSYEFYDQDAYSIVSARASFTTADGVWEFSVFGNNLTDEDYLTFVWDNTKSFGFVGATRNTPRTYGASVNYTF